MTIKIVVKKENQETDSAGEVMTLEDLLINIGSANSSTVRLSGDGVAPEQAVIINENGQSLLINQAAGTILNGKEVEQGIPNELKTDDLIKIGSYNLIVKLENQPSSIKTSSPTKNSKLLNNEDQAEENGFQASKETSESNKLEVGTFADILSSLRKDEDQFYFQVTETDGAKRRLPIESDKIILGWDKANDFFSTAQDTIIDQPQAVVRKDWSGVTIYPNGNEAILLNDALLEAAARLKNGDRLIFSRRLVEEASTQFVTLVFCEPAALIELNAILPQELLSNALETNRSGEITIEPELEDAFAPENSQPTASEAGEKQSYERDSMYFGYFALADLIILIVGTILTTALTYILLEFS